MQLLTNCIIFASALCPILAFEFVDPGNEWITFNSSGGTTQQILMDENNPENIEVVLITGAQSAPTVLFLYGNEDLFSPTVEAIGSDYAITIGKSIDYEISDRFLVQVTDSAGNDQQRFNLRITNLDDENPSITSSTCTMKENTTIDINNADCAYTISDKDGFLSNMNFTIISSTNGQESTIFEFAYKTPPADNVYTAEVYLVLQIDQLLDFEDTTLYIFTLEATDSGGNPTTPSSSIQIIVQVEDVADEIPVWTSFLYTSTFEEETEQTFQVTARDGDIGINNPIKYKIEESADIADLVKIDEDTGLINVEKIDRDIGYDTITFTITAYEVGDEESKNSQSITFIITDVDDNNPEITVANSQEGGVNLEIDEGYSGSLDAQILINDIDLGVNAMYTVALTDSNGNEYTSAFQVVPTRGYQNSSFQITVTNSAKLDYETSDWQNIDFEVIATGDVDATRQSTLPVKIQLRDINDEYPEFENNNEYTVTVFENITINEFVKTVLATDKDANDVVSHYLLGTASNRILTIDELSGDITTSRENAFDYETQRELYVQIQARDLFNHSSTAQLTINVQDVNDENPTLSVSSSVFIMENQENGTILDITIRAVDADTTADLEFFIDWDQSYATKNSIRLTDEVFSKAKCVAVETIKTDDDNNNASAELSLIEIIVGQTPDYETFDTLYVYLQVTDLNTEMNAGTDSATIIINIENINDNPPVFTENSLNVNRTVSELATVGSSVGSVTATDDDNLKELAYMIEPTDEDTPDWIDIDSRTGILTVKDVELDCDDPVRFYLNYTITVTDGDFNETLDISIFIIDQNDNRPTMVLSTIEIMENVESGTIIYQSFNATDGDRDAPYNEIAYELYIQSTTDITNRFKVDGDTLMVNLINGATLDRDHGQSSFTCRITYKDNPINYGAIQFSDTADLIINLLDYNDEIPTVTTTSISTSESLLRGEQIVDKILAVDDDEPGDNSRISFALTAIDQYEDSTYETPVGSVSIDLFIITTDDENESKEATLIANQDLKDYYGYYILTITTEDFGDPVNTKDDNTVNLEIKKYNFEPPIFTFPESGATYYLQLVQTSKSQLYLYNAVRFPNIEATDQQNDKYDITFTVTSEADDGLFMMSYESFPQSTGQLQLATDAYDTSKTYELTLVANVDKDQTQSSGEASYTAEIPITIKFYDITSDPSFNETEMSGAFDEGQGGWTQSVLIKIASYPINDIPNLHIYYLLRTGNKSLFNVDIDTGTITLNNSTELDYETEDSYVLVIQASKNEDLNYDADPNTLLTVTIQVNNINDNPPEFDRSNYYGGIMSSYQRGTRIIQVTVTDKDGDLNPFSYSIDYTSLDAVGNAINGIDKPFLMDQNTGDITLDFTILVNMNGYFTFDIYVSDTLFEASAAVKIYIISETNRVNFRFENTLLKVQNETSNILAILDEEFTYNSNIEKIEPDSTSTGVDLSNQTVVSVYFIDESINEPVDQNVIVDRVTDVTVYSRLRQSFSAVGLILMTFDVNNQSSSNLAEQLKSWLIGVSVVLGMLCVILMITFFLKTRALNQRINNLSTTKFGSQESGLNRQGISAPTTNKHAIEGSNPVFNKNEIKAEELDRKSVDSGDSDLIGIEDNPEFDYENDKKDIIN